MDREHRMQHTEYSV